MIVQTEENVKASQAEVAGLQQEVTMIQARIDKRNEILKNVLCPSKKVEER